MRPFPGKLEKYRGKYFLDHNQEEWLRTWFPETENSRLMKASGMTHSTLHRFARLYGLTKSKRGLHHIMKRQAKAANRTKERNGYYDSLRGKAPTEACMRSYQEYLKSDRYKHHLQILKERNPWRYAARRKAMSEHRKALIRREKARVVYGLPMKTNLHRMVTIKPYTRLQTFHRYSALKRGYILMAECHEGSGYRWKIFYDENTRRMPIFERNCVADGFTFHEWQDIS